MKYENPLEKTPCINAMVAVLCGADSTEELLELGIAKSRNTLYEILESLEREGLIFKDQDYKPMPIKPVIEPLLSLLKLRQVHNGMSALLVPEFENQVKKRFLRMRNKNNFAEFCAILKEFETKLPKGSLENQKIGEAVLSNTPAPIERLMRCYLENFYKIGKKSRKDFVALIIAMPFKNFSEFFDSFFFMLHDNGGKISKKLKGKEKQDFEGYLIVLNAGWNKNQAFLNLLERNKMLGKIYEPLRAVGF